MLLAAAVVAAACGASTAGATRAAPPTGAMSGMQDMPDMSGMDDMPGMSAAPTPTAPVEAAPTGDGLSAAEGGYAFVPGTATVAAGRPGTFTFHIGGRDGHAVTRFQPYESELVLFDVVRSDLTQYRHLEPAMRQDGTWSVALPALPAGSYRAYATFAAPDVSEGKPLVYRLSRPFTVLGRPTSTPLPGPVSTVDTDGYRVALSGHAVAGTPAPLAIAVTRGGQQVGYFQRYLDGYAHVTAFRVGDLAVGHLSPAAKVPGAGLSTTALFPKSGTWRVFVQFRTDGPPHTAAFTITVG